MSDKTKQVDLTKVECRNCGPVWVDRAGDCPACGLYLTSLPALHRPRPQPTSRGGTNAE